MNYRRIREFFAHPVRMFLSYVSPKFLANIFYKNVTPGRKGINWKHPENINEIINYLKFYSDTSMWSLFSDKYRVREYVKNKGLGHILLKEYGVWSSADDIDFNSLPEKFVLKTNHGSGTNLLVQDKNKLDINSTRTLVKEWLKSRIGQETVEFHYLKINPLVYAEEFLEDESVKGFSQSVVDYKFWVLGGKCRFVFVCVDRDESNHSKHPFFDVYDLEWNRHSDWLINCNTSKPIDQPGNFDKMIEYAERLAEGHPQMRVDFYNVGGKIYFGELTLTSQGGYMDYFSSACLKQMGEWTNLDKYVILNNNK